MRQYIAQNMPDKNGNLTISGKDFKYLSQVLRLNCNDEIWVRFPDENLVEMSVSKIQSKQIILVPARKSSEDDSHVKPNTIKMGDIEYWVFQFVPMHAQLDLIIRQCVECGVAKIVPVLGERSPRFNEQTLKAKSERFERLVKEARQQSGSPVDSKIFEPMNLSSALELWKKNSFLDEKSLNSERNFAEDNIGANSVAFVLHEANIADKTLFDYITSTVNTSEKRLKRVALAIGPEGGMTESEVSAFKNIGFNLIHFETNVLRCETACLYGIAAIQTAITELKSWQKSE